MHTLENLNRIAMSQPSSPMKKNDQNSSIKARPTHEMAASVISMTPMVAATDMDAMSNASALKVVNDENDVTPVTPLDEKQGGLFASLRAVFSGGVFGTDTKKREKNSNMLDDSIVIEKKSSEEDEKESDKEKHLEGEDGEEDGLPQVMDCEDYAYQSSDEEGENPDLRDRIPI